MLYNKAIKEKNIIDANIKSLKKKLKNLPEGKLVCNKNGKSYKWFHSNGGRHKYIPKSQEKFAKELATKTYYSLWLEYLQNEKMAIEKYLSIHKESDSAVELLAENKEFRRLLSSEFVVASDELKQWAEASYESNPIGDDSLTVGSTSGRMLRSKAEAMIDSLLHEAKIPFRYEAALVLGKHKIYPDFTIRHPISGELYYWEHFGMMDDPDYAKRAFEKLELYNSNGIVPTINLIITFETKKHPLGMDTMAKLIKEYFW